MAVKYLQYKYEDKLWVHIILRAVRNNKFIIQELEPAHINWFFCLLVLDEDCIN